MMARVSLSQSEDGIVVECVLSRRNVLTLLAKQFTAGSRCKLICQGVPLGVAWARIRIESDRIHYNTASRGGAAPGVMHAVTELVRSRSRMPSETSQLPKRLVAITITGGIFMRLAAKLANAQARRSKIAQRNRNRSPRAVRTVGRWFACAAGRNPGELTKSQRMILEALWELSETDETAWSFSAQQVREHLKRASPSHSVVIARLRGAGPPG